jgi:hypothetical protein
MRLLLAAIGIVALIGTGTAVQMRFPSKQVAVAEATAGVPVYKIDANYVKTLPEQEIPLRDGRVFVRLLRRLPAHQSHSPVSRSRAAKSAEGEALFGVTSIVMGCSLGAGNLRAISTSRNLTRAL